MNWAMLVIATAPPTIAACGALLLGWINSRKLQSIHVDINSRITQLIDLTEKAFYAKGVADQKDSGTEGK